MYKPHLQFLTQNLSKKVRLIHESLWYFQKITKRRSSYSIAINLCKEHNYPPRYCKHGWHTSNIWCAVKPHNQPHGRENYQDSNDQEREESRNCCAGLCCRRIEVETNGDIQEKNCAQGCKQAWSCDCHPRERLDGHWRHEDMSSESLACATRWPGETKKPVSLRHIWNSRDRKRESSIREREHELGCNSGWININFAALRCCLEQTF